MLEWKLNPSKFRIIGQLNNRICKCRAATNPSFRTSTKETEFLQITGLSQLLNFRKRKNLVQKGKIRLPKNSKPS